MGWAGARASRACQAGNPSDADCPRQLTAARISSDESSWLPGQRSGARDLSLIRREVPVGAAPSLDARLLELSGGNQQKVVVGRWLEAMPKMQVALLDEPTMESTSGPAGRILRHPPVVRRTTRERPSCSPRLSEEVVAVADRAVILARGQVVGELTGDELTEDSLLALAHSGSAQRVNADGMRRENRVLLQSPPMNGVA